ncbi:hypothetical protein AVEN_181638-1 [Araneus ventricosus]|uniref:Uncharacterized protein n=1 Tax=Araneus ventricosus TaxID=182803 RepID=A0A4Y2CM56_ARAVE|nr:hypothetical protein AVEN_181638-1 [Araneus ventricosus]
MNHILNSMIEAKHVDENVCDEILMEFDDYLDNVALKHSDFSEFSPGNSRVDEFFYETMNTTCGVLHYVYVLTFLEKSLKFFCFKCTNHVIEGDPKPCSDDLSEQEKRVYEFRKVQAYTSTYQSFECQFQPLIAGITDRKKAWQILKENFKPTSRVKLTGLIDEFFELNYNAEEETIGIYCKRVQEKCELIKESGFELPEELVCFQLIRKLPQGYDNLVQILYRLDKDEFTVKNIELQLINEFGRVQQKRKDELHRNVANAYETRFPERPKAVNRSEQDVDSY